MIALRVMSYTYIAHMEISIVSWWSDAVTALAALVGVALGAYLSHRYSRNRDHLELKRDVLRRVMGYRWTLTEGRQDPEGHFFTALNEALVVFAGDEKVGNEIQKFHKIVGGAGFRAAHLQPLAEAMARSARVPQEEWDNTMFERPFTPPQRDQPSAADSSRTLGPGGASGRGSGAGSPQ